ncbi:PREDICTED: uncharacterized protein PF11_0213-like isoform X2 [Papilio polytes]|uniref:uncharacterized protein PF11_0213-like isoform X2 n=1 Tax=Papilio polytes TaxID=76194 RepID=UPI000676462F|nr:PREDICTED: uncharacterized protein PF11_0213-like isoform X2 [Papilio polytes]
MAKLCCVGGCIAKDVVYFRFPNSKTQCKKWIEAMNLTTKLSYNSVICSDHFKPEDYGVVRGKVRLKPKVIPKSQNEQKQNETSNSNANKENSLDNQKIGNRKVKNKAEERKNSVEDVNGDVQNDTIVANNIKDAKNKKNTKHTKNTKGGKNTKDSENANRAKVAENTKNVENTKVAENVNNTKNTIDVENTNVAKNTKDAETTKVAENTSNAKNTKNTKDTSDTSSDEEPLSKHRATKDSLKNLSESITQVDLNANASTENDIEDILTYYSIKQNKKVAERQTEEIHRERNGQSIVDLSVQENEPAPVFIEVAVNEEQNRETGSPQDCLMVLESVQVELDPNELMMSDVDENGPNGEQADPISLVTSSDDDDVIIEEPHIDTVEVSDATDEDDVPLVRLLPSTARLRPRWRAPNPFYRKDVWGTYQDTEQS